MEQAYPQLLSGEASTRSLGIPEAFVSVELSRTLCGYELASGLGVSL